MILDPVRRRQPLRLQNGLDLRDLRVHADTSNDQGLRITRAVIRSNVSCAAEKGVACPRVLHEERPQYTSAAMRAKIQGSVTLEIVVRPDGSVGDVRVIRSLDSSFGLDRQAIIAAKKWRFAPGTRNGEPTPVVMTIDLTFVLR